MLHHVPPTAFSLVEFDLGENLPLVGSAAVAHAGNHLGVGDDRATRQVVYRSGEGEGHSLLHSTFAAAVRTHDQVLARHLV